MAKKCQKNIFDDFFWLEKMLKFCVLKLVDRKLAVSESRDYSVNSVMP